MNRQYRESAVSDTIGVILAVAIAVILSTIVVAYVMALMPSLLIPHIIALTASQPDNDHIKILYHGGPDQKSLVSLRIIWPPDVCSEQLVTSPKVGETYTCSPSGGGASNPFIGRDHIMVIGNFGFNEEQVVLDAYV